MEKALVGGDDRSHSITRAHLSNASETATFCPADAGPTIDEFTEPVGDPLSTVCTTNRDRLMFCAAGSRNYEATSLRDGCHVLSTGKGAPARGRGPELNSDWPAPATPQYKFELRALAYPQERWTPTVAVAWACIVHLRITYRTGQPIRRYSGLKGVVYVPGVPVVSPVQRLRARPVVPTAALVTISRR